MRESRRRIEAVVRTAATSVENLLVESSPFFPDLLHQPDVVCVPRLGRLVAVYVYAPTQRVNWVAVLAAAEDLFELKSSVGQSTVAIAVCDFQVGLREASINAPAFLEQMFDLVIPITEGTEGAKWERMLREAIREAEPKPQHFQLWESERQRASDELERFSEPRYANLVAQRRMPRRRPEKELVQAVAAAAERRGIPVEREALIRTPKEPIAGLRERSQFAFDLAFSNRAGHQVLVDVASFGRYVSRNTVRYLMMKGRFTGYEPVAPQLIEHDRGQPVHLARRRERLHRILLFEGNIAGPEHDPFRYVRALVSAGWDISRAEPGELVRQLTDANV